MTNPQGTKLCTIQVKTRTGGGNNRSWRLNQKHENIFGDRLFYCFVDLGSDDKQEPKTYVIPSKEVAELARESHKVWLSQPGQKGQKRNDSGGRALWSNYSFVFGARSNYDDGWLSPYEENWDLLGLD